MIRLDPIVRTHIAEYYFGDDTDAVDATILAVEEGSKRHGFITYIDSPDIGEDRLTDIGIVLPEVKSEEIINKLGIEAILWSAANAYRLELIKQHTHSIAIGNNIDYSIVHQVIADSRENRRVNHARSLTSRLGLAKYLNNAPENVDIEPLVIAHYKKGMQIPTDRAQKYGLVAIRVPNGWGSGFISHDWPGSETVTYKPPYLDAPYGLMLTYGEAPVAYASYRMKSSTDVTVVQMQGVTGKMNNTEKKYRPHGLSCIEWQHLFLSIGEGAARHIGATVLRVAPTYAASNIPGSLERHYERPAMQYGLTPENTQSWQLRLT